MFDAYNIRKIAPRMLLAVIAVNLSIYLCVAVVDIINVVGGGLGALIRGPFLDTNSFDSTEFDVGSGAGGKIASGAIVGLLVGAGGAGFLGSMLAGAITLATGSIAFILIVLLLLILGAILIALAIMATVVIRYGAIILLTLVSPIAISMLVLPGTEKYFRKWWEYFIKTLMVYPIIAAIFAVSDVMGAIFLEAQSREGGGGFGDPMAIFVVIAVVYAPLFMIPFSFKLAGGFLGSIYDFANKNMYGRAKPAMDKWKERPDSLYSQKKMQAQKTREGKGLTFSQIGKGIASGTRGAFKPGEDEHGNRVGRAAAFRNRYKSASLYQGGSASRAAAIEAEEKDGRVKDMLGNDDMGYAAFKYAEALSQGKSKAEAETAARQALAYKDPYMYDTDPNATDKDGNAITNEERRRRIEQQTGAIDQVKSVHGTYGDQTTMMIGARQDARSSTGEDAVSMREQVLAATNGGQDQLGMTAFLNDTRTLSKEAKRVDKAGIGFSSDIGVMEQLKAGKINSGQARKDLLMGALEKSSASEIATMHDKGIREMQDVLKERIEEARNNAVSNIQQNGGTVTPDAIKADAGYQRSMAQAANLYDAFQYAAPKNMEQLSDLISDQSITGTGGTVLDDLEEMRGDRGNFAEFAANRRDWGAKEAENAARQGGGQPQPGGQGG